MNILEQIIADKRMEIEQARSRVSLEAMREQALARPVPPDFRAALSTRPVGLIAEVKRRSPSAGVIRDPFDPADIARAYERGGAQALSVLMDGKYFGGGADDFRAVRAAVSLPLLYKEFVVAPWQVWQARALGASAVLLIVAALTPDELRAFMDVIREAGMQALVEVHDEDEARIALAAGASIVGINNRNLKNFATTLATTGNVARGLPADTFVISESGIRDAADVLRVQSLGARAVLVGEHLLRKDDLVRAVGDLMEPAWISS